MAFNSTQFVQSFPQTLVNLENSEKITKAVLKELSRDLLSLLHTKNDKQGDIGYINKTINVLTPVNRRAFIALNKEFTGFILSDDGISFLKKSKKHYDNVSKMALAWLDDPMNNIWSWSERNLKVEKEDNVFDYAMFKDNLAKLAKRANKANISHVDMIGAMFETGITLQDLIDCLEKTDKLSEVVTLIDEEFAEIETPMVKG